MDPKVLDDLSRRLVDAVPPGFRQVQEDLQSTFTSILRTTLFRMNLITREEFDVQAGVLARTRSKLEALEAQVTALEEKLGRAPKTVANSHGAASTHGDD